MKPLILLAALLLSAPAEAETVAQFSAGGKSISLTNEPCALTSISNLAYRATWTEAGKSFEGCYGLFYDTLILLYFDDKTVVPLPAQAFKPASNI